ncbi:MAG: BatA domain-containing protein [Candidatus Omnitrophica bacterium]|nr:BatA domain-containing protein [Candidatus Omnitrophota bacterium]
MMFLSPIGLLWLASLPVLIWLWRLTAAKRQTRVASLIPFEHLLKRTSTRRRRLVVNWLFWLQAAVLAGAALALAQPMLRVARAKTILVMLDTSASMAARQGGSTALQRAKSALSRRLARKAPGDQVLLLATAPAAPLTSQPTSDGTTLGRLIDQQQARDLGGHLATTRRLGRALLGQAPDEVWVATDEPAPAMANSGSGSPPPEAASTGLRWMGVGRPLPNVAIVGIDALGPLCDASESRVIVTVHSFSSRATSARLTARQDGRQLAQQTASLAAAGPQTLILPLPANTHGIVEVQLEAAPDALAVDNRAWAIVQPAARLPVVLSVSRAASASTLSRWLSACAALSWTSKASAASAAVLITDREELWQAAQGPALLIRPPPSARPTVSHPAIAPRPSAVGGTAVQQPTGGRDVAPIETGLPVPGAQPVALHWMIAPDHPIGFYLSPLETVAASIAAPLGEVPQGMPVVSAFVDGRKVPVILAGEHRGRRRVEWRVDVAGQEASPLMTVAFFNSLRWLMGDRDAATTRETLVIDGWAPGEVAIQHPDGTTHRQPAIDGAVRFESATKAGVYRVLQASREVHRAVNFLDPLESNTMERASTWGGASPADAAQAPPRSARAATHPLAQTIMVLLAVLLVAEWWLYSARGRMSGTGGMGQGAVAQNPQPRTQNLIRR